MKLLFVFLFAFLFLGNSEQAISNPQEKKINIDPDALNYWSSRKMWSMSLMPLMHEADIKKFYRHYDVHHVLALSMGGDLSPIRLADLFHPLELQVVGTDIQPLGNKNCCGPSNFSFYHQDNNASFMFSQNSFQIITLRCGLCVCNKPYWWWQSLRTCAGLLMTEKALEHFFSKILYMLDDHNEHSHASLEGCSGKSCESVIRGALQKVLKSNQRWGAEIMRNQNGDVEGVFFAQRIFFQKRLSS